MKESRGAKKQMRKSAEEMSSDELLELRQGAKRMMNNMLKGGMTPKDAMQINPNALENVYAQAYRLYNTGKYIEAVHLFRILILFNAMDPKYLLGLAACFHMLKEYKNAIQSYTMCAMMDATTPIPFYHQSDCFIQMKDYTSAMVCLQMAIDLSGHRPEYAQIKERSQLTLESLKQQNLTSHPFPMQESDYTLFSEEFKKGLNDQ